MIKLVKFNLLIDGQRCRMIEDLRNNFNLLDVMEEFQNGKLEKWLKVRNVDEQFDLIKAIDKNSDLLQIAQQLCKIFDITISEDDLKNELMVIEYQRNAPKLKENKKVIKQIFDSYQDNIKNLKPSIKTIKITNKGNKSRFADSLDVISKNVYVIVIFLTSNFPEQKSNFELTSFNENKISKLENFSNTTVFNGLKVKFDSVYDDDVIEISVLDLYNKLDEDSLVNGAIFIDVVNVK